MVIIEADICGPIHIASFRSKAAAFYFLKSISSFSDIEEMISMPTRTKFKVRVLYGHFESNWNGARKSSKDFKENDKEFLFFAKRDEIRDSLGKTGFWGCSSSNEIEAEMQKRLDYFTRSLGSKVIDIEMFENRLDRIYLITVE